jgi:hypothetical protein
MVGMTGQIDYVMTWAEKLLADEATFPTKAGREFNPNTFPSSARHLYTQFLRIFAHLYHAHFDHFVHVSPSLSPSSWGFNIHIDMFLINCLSGFS